MKVLVDTSVWSLALRRPKTIQLAADQQDSVNALADLVRDGRAVLMGAIRQELLCGIKTLGQFETLRNSLAAFDDVALSMQDYEVAAEAFNTCRANGAHSSNTDFLICAVSINHHLPDGHFKFPHLWPVKFLQAGRLNYRFFGGCEFDVLS